MKKIEVIEIDNFIKAIPQKRTWYKYFGDIFVSVMCLEGRQSHIRKKNPNEYKSVDNRMCYWHCHWQYELIETFYGNKVEGIKTYEKTIYHDNEKHIIDSVVNNISIEFQHTLSVSIEEMDSRWYAQKHFEYTPYLVLDFTTFQLPDFFKNESIYSNSSIKKLLQDLSLNSNEKTILKRLLKWSTSQHFKNNNLFIHFQNEVVRFNNQLLYGHIKLKKEEFVEELIGLENLLNEHIGNDKIEIEKRKKLLEEQRNFDAKLRLVKENLNDEIEKQAKKDRLVRNNTEKEKNADFRFYRMILNEAKIFRRLHKLNLNEVIFEYDNYSENINNIKIKHHVYLSEELNLLFIYSTKGIIDSTNKYSFVSSEIKISRRDYCEIRTFTYKQIKKESVKLAEYRSELVLGYLHSLKDYALIKFDTVEKQIEKKHYVFNKFVYEDIFNVVSSSMESQIPLDYLFEEFDLSIENQAKTNETIKKICKENDKYFFIEDIVSNYGVNIENIKNYYEDEEVTFKSYLLEKFYICNY